VKDEEHVAGWTPHLMRGKSKVRPCPGLRADALHPGYKPIHAMARTLEVKRTFLSVITRKRRVTPRKRVIQ